jgi:pimeloyl-ACP methyl ester carboxylesterase
MLAAVDGGVELVETVHAQLVPRWLPCRRPGAIGAFAYRRARACTARLRRWADVLFEHPAPAPGETVFSGRREAVVAALNGVVGDYLAGSGNPLAIPMQLRSGGQALRLDRSALARAFPQAGGKLVVLVHGLCRNDLQWRRGGHDHGAALARDLGYTPLYLHYNTGLHVSINGRALADLLETLAGQWPVPVEEIVILGHSMGGLVARSACHYGQAAGHAWRKHLASMIFLGTPHQGATLERGSNWLTTLLGRTAYTTPIAKLGRIRSAGITDLRYGSLLDEDWLGRDRFEHADDGRLRVPLPRNVRCYAIAGSAGRRNGDLRERLLGDGLVSLDSALGRQVRHSRGLGFAKSRQWIAYGNHHLDLLGRVDVYEKIREWLER